MNSSKDADKANNEPNRRGAAHWRLWLLSLLVILLAGGALFGVRHRRRAQTTVAAIEIKDARAALQARFREPNELYRRQYAQDAEALSRDYLRAGGTERDSAALLLVAALNFQRKPPTGIQFADIDLNNVPAGDLEVAAQSFAQIDQIGPAEHLVGLALTKGEHREELLRLAIDLRMPLGKYDAAADNCRELAKLAPQDPFPWMKLAVIYEAKGYVELLMDVYQRIIELSPEYSTMARFGLVEALLAHGDALAARREFDRLKTTGPELLDDTPLLEAKLLHLEGELDRSLAIAETCLLKQPNDAQALQLQCRILLVQSEAERALKSLERLVAIQPNGSEAHFLLGRAYGQLGQPQKARQHFERFRELVDRTSVSRQGSNSQ
jgi:Flp pilus assembly protein TadD